MTPGNDERNDRLERCHSQRACEDVVGKVRGGLTAKRLGYHEQGDRMLEQARRIAQAHRYGQDEPS